MTKEKFCQILRELEEGERLQCKVASAVRQFNSIVGSDFPEPYGMVIAHDFLVIDLLMEIMCDEDRDIEYFCCELDYGKKFTMGDVVEEDGTQIDFSSADKLYDYLITRR